MTGPNERDEIAAVLLAASEPERATMTRPAPDERVAHLYGYLADAILASDYLAERDQRIKAEAVEQVARHWQFGGWTILTAPPPAGSIPSLALGQRVTDWLRDRADRIERGQ